MSELNNDYIIGDATRISLSVIDAATGALVDPGGLALKLRPPGGVATTHTYSPDAGIVVRDGVGLYHAELDLDAHGRWYWRWQTTAPNVGVAEGSLRVMRTRFP